MRYKVIITGANGLIGEGVLLECLENPFIEEILVVSRWTKNIMHPKVKELIIPDFLELDASEKELTGYDACFYCADITALGLEETIYNHITFDITVNFALKLLMLNPDIMFNYLSDYSADRTERSKRMLARIKGKTENALNKLIFKRIHHFRPGLVKPLSSQKNVRFYHKVTKVVYPLLKFVAPNKVITVKELALAMINVLLKDYPERTIRVKDMRYLASNSVGLAKMADKFSISAIL